MEWFDGKGVCFQSKDQGVKLHGLCCVWSSMLIEYSPIEFLKKVPRLITWPTYLSRLSFNLA